MESGDFNGDGVLDLVVVGREFSGRNGIAAMMFGNGRGEFGPPVPINSGLAGDNPLAVELRDFNHDCKADLALLNTGKQNVVIMLGNGRGEFTPSATFNTAFMAKALASADFNNDGNLDLVANIPSVGKDLILVKRAEFIAQFEINVAFRKSGFCDAGRFFRDWSQINRFERHWSLLEQ